MNYSTIICELVYIIPPLHQSDCRIRSNYLSDEAVYSSQAAVRIRRCNMIEASIRAVCVALGQLIITSLTKPYTARYILSMIRLQRHCDTETPMDSTRLQNKKHIK